MTWRLRTGTLIVGLGLLMAGVAHAQKAGGILKAVQRENPPSLSIHEEATVSTVWPMSPVYNNLVFFNPAHAVESADDLVGELAEHWSWSDGHKRLTFKLRHGVKWHDGKPFTSADSSTPTTSSGAR